MYSNSAAIFRGDIAGVVEQAKDFEAHLDVLSIYTEFMIYGAISSYDLERLRRYSEASPRNALFQAFYYTFDGDQTLATEILLDESLFPADRLATDADHFTHYLWQRDENEDWQPCGSSEKRPCEGITHAPVDYLFAARILELSQK